MTTVITLFGRVFDGKMEMLSVETPKKKECGTVYPENLGHVIDDRLSGAGRDLEFVHIYGTPLAPGAEA